MKMFGGSIRDGILWDTVGIKALFSKLLMAYVAPEERRTQTRVFKMRFKIMSVFDMRGQKVNKQTNIKDDRKYYGTAEKSREIIVELEKLKTEIAKIRDAEVVDAEIVTNFQNEIEKTVEQAQKSKPNKDVMIKHLGKAKDFIKGVGEASEIVQIIKESMEVVEGLF